MSRTGTAERRGILPPGGGALLSIIMDSVARNAFAELVVKAHSSQRLHEPVEKAAVTKEYRITTAPVYMPNRRDAHNEAVSEDALFDAVLDFQKNGSRRLNLQHGDLGNHTVGDILAVWTWPYDVDAELLQPATGEVVKLRVPAGTAWMTVQWDKDAWQLVKSGKITGFSMGGTAVRRLDPAVAKLPHMGHKVLAKSGRVLSAANLQLIRDMAALCEELLSKEPRTAAEKSKRDAVAHDAALSPDGDGVLMVCEELGGVVHARKSGRIELLREPGVDSSCS
jgi:Putative phage serine protease XkdF